MQRMSVLSCPMSRSRDRGFHDRHELASIQILAERLRLDLIPGECYVAVWANQIQRIAPQAATAHLRSPGEHLQRQLSRVA